MEVVALVLVILVKIYSFFSSFHMKFKKNLNSGGPLAKGYGTNAVLVGIVSWGRSKSLS